MGVSESVDATGAHSARVHRGHVTSGSVTRDPSQVGSRRVASTAHDVRQTGAELVGQERVQQRVEAAVEVVEDEGDRSDDEMPVGELLQRTVRLPQHTHVVGQHADGERDDDGDQQSDHFASAAECSLVCSGAERRDVTSPGLVTSRQ